MLKCASIYTYEIDDPEIALREIKAQLDEKITLLENSAGIIMCHPEFVGTGVFKYICDNLPFDLVGVTTSSQVVNGEAGELILTIFIMTSDDIRFKTGVTGCLEEDIDAPTRSAFAKAALGDSKSPELALVFPPLILKYAGDLYVNIWEKIIPNVPLFGTLAIDDTLSFEGSATLYNGESYKTAMSFVLCYGNINPRFLIGTLPEGNAMPYKGEITKSNGPFVQEINNINAYKYFEDLGLAVGGAPTDSFLFMPFVIDQKRRKDYDGIPVMRGIASFTGDGTAIYRGNVDEGSTFAILTCNAAGILSTSMQKIEQIKNLQDVNGILIFSCIVRRMLVMEVDPLLEIEGAKNNFTGVTPFMMGYAGGEICPTSITDNIPTNRFHNYSLIILAV